MARNPYDVLGVSKSATPAEIKSAFRKLAKAHHPDRNAGNDAAATRFAEANAAYEILGDPEARGRFDRGEIDADGKPRAPSFEGFGFGPRGARPASGGASGFESFHFGFGAGAPFNRGGEDARDPRSEFEGLDAFARFFAHDVPPGAGRTVREDVERELSVTLDEVVKGGSRRVRAGDGREVDVSIPPGVAEGQRIRLRGQAGPSGGDLHLVVRIAPHPRVTVDGRDLRLTAGVPLVDAVLGGTVRVAAPGGEVELRVPPMTSGGRTLRLRGKGLPAPGRGDAARGDAGDLLVTIQIVLPDEDAELEALMRARRAGASGAGT